MTKYTVTELVEKCIARDLNAQRYIFDTYSSRLLGVIIRYFNELEDAEDVLVDSFHLILTRMDSYSGNEDERVLFGWMRKICVNQSLTRIRRDKARNKELRMEDEYHFIACDNDIIDILDEKERTKQLLNFIHELPRQQRVVFNLYAIEGFSHKQIADELGISEGTSKSNYCRAKDKLKIKLENIKIYEEVENY